MLLLRAQISVLGASASTRKQTELYQTHRKVTEIDTTCYKKRKVFLRMGVEGSELGKSTC